MTHELSALVAVILVQFLAIALTQGQLNRELGRAYNQGPRDAEVVKSALLGRLQRMVANGFESLALFAPLAIIISVTGQMTLVTAAAAWIHVLARLLYIPAYAYGLTPWRSVIWVVGALATLTLAVSALF